VLVADINPGPPDSIFSRFTATASNDLLFFDAFEPTTGAEVWKTDGTGAGTVRLTDINPGPGSSQPFDRRGRPERREFTELNGQIFFRAFEPDTGVELWALRSSAQVVTNCGNGMLEPGEECDDGNVADGDCCSSACRFEPAGTACADDGNLCTADQCDGAGVCIHPAALAPACGPAMGRGASLQLEDKRKDARDRLVWMWRNGAAISKADFGNPLTTSSYALCVYETAGDGSPSLVLGAAAPAGGRCGKHACWKASRRGFAYHGSGLSPNGLLSLGLKAGNPGNASIAVTGRGAKIQMPRLPLSTPIIVQLKRGDGDRCWEARYSSAAVNRPGELKARSDSR